MRRDQAGFTLTEILLSMAIIATLAGISLPVYASIATRNQLSITTQRIVAAMRRSQTYARGVNRDSDWGVRVVTGQATLFKGSSYAMRDAAYDETLVIPGSITVSGLSEVSFSKLSATPTTTGTITLTSTTKDTRNITLNDKGMVQY